MNEKRYFIIPDLDDRVYVLEEVGGEWTGVAYFNNGAAGMKTWTLEALQSKWAREITHDQAVKRLHDLDFFYYYGITGVVESRWVK